MAFHLYQDMFQIIDEVLDGFVFESVANLVAIVAPLFTSLVVIACAIWGYMIIYGKADTLVQEGFFKILRVTFILTLGLSVSYYMELIVTTSKGSGAFIASSLTGNPVDNIALSLDTMMERVFAVASHAWEKAGILSGDFGMYIIALLVGIGGAIVITYMSFLILSSKILTAGILAIGPIFFVLLLFDSTKRWFENWLGYLVNAVLMLILAVLFGNLCLHIIKILFDKITANNPDTATLATAIILTIVFFTAFMVLSQVPSIAAGLGGGVSLATKGAVSLFYTAGGQGISPLTQKELLESSLRMKPDRIFLSELIRGTEAFYFLRNVNSGHPGSMTTMHANSPQMAIEQLVLFLKEAGTGFNRQEAKDLILMCVDIIIQIHTMNGKRIMTEIYYDPHQKHSILS
jgi:type IV secretion system protein VirB6